MKATFYATSKGLVSFIQKRFVKKSSTSIIPPPPSSSSTLPKATLLENSSSFAVEFLTKSCGLAFQSAISVSRKLRLDHNNLQNPQSVLHFLKSHHFDDTQIASLIKKCPHFLQCRVEKNLRPKFDFLVANGFAGKFLPQLILLIPQISKYSLDSKIKPSFEFLKSYVYSDEKIALAIKRCPWLLYTNLKGTIQLNIDFLTKEGVSIDRISKLIVNNPVTLLRGHDRLVDVVIAIKNLGLEPGDANFVHVVAVRIQMNESTWKKKIEVMMSLGWSEEETLRAFKRYPHILACSEEKIRRGMDFFLNVVESGREIVFSHPSLLYLSLDKRLRPRYDVIKILMSKNLIEKERKIARLLIIGEANFLKNYVVKYADEVPGLLETFVITTKTKNVDI